MQDWIIDIAKQFKGDLVTDRLVQALVSEIAHREKQYSTLQKERAFLKEMLDRVPRLAEKYGIEDLLELRTKLADAYYMLNNELILYKIGAQDAETTLKDMNDILQTEIRPSHIEEPVYEWSGTSGRKEEKNG